MQKIILSVFFLFIGPVLMAQTDIPLSDSSGSAGTNGPSTPSSSPAVTMTNSSPATNTPGPSPTILTQVTASSSQSNIKKTKTVPKKSSRMVNLGFYYLLADSSFKEKFSSGQSGQTVYYRMPFNSWNDPFSVILDYDWKFFDLPMLRWGWSIGFNLAGSGNGDDSILVKKETDLGQAHQGEFYVIYNDYHFPFFINIKFQPLEFSIFKFYLGAGAGALFGIYTYNELTTKERSAYDEQYERMATVFKPMGRVFLGFTFDVSSDFSTMFLEMSYTVIQDPVVLNDALHRHVSFQISGFSLGFGFRY
ncbi:MAG: hypothetical protein PHF84_02810 [bacterium]|nr:hypothetical protein [bacterium]